MESENRSIGHHLGPELVRLLSALVTHDADETSRLLDVAARHLAKSLEANDRETKLLCNGLVVWIQGILALLRGSNPQAHIRTLLDKLGPVLNHTVSKAATSVLDTILDETPIGAALRLTSGQEAMELIQAQPSAIEKLTHHVPALDPRFVRCAMAAINRKNDPSHFIREMQGLSRTFGLHAEVVRGLALLYSGEESGLKVMMNGILLQVQESNLAPESGALDPKVIVILMDTLGDGAMATLGPKSATDGRATQAT